MILRACDLETTGVPTPEDPHAIVEIGWCDLPATEYHSVLCNPGRPIPFDAMAVHHITDAMVAGATGSADVLGRPDFFVAHNADLERQFIKTDVPWICTYKVALRVWPDMPSHSLQYLRYALDLPVRGDIPMPHRAGPDAYVCALLLEAIMAHENAPDIDAMVRWSNGLALLPTCPLFKHKGKKWADVPTDYLDWIVNKPNDVSRDVKANAKLELGRRK